MIGDKLFQAVSFTVEQELQKAINSTGSKNQDEPVMRRPVAEPESNLDSHVDVQIENLKKYLSELVYADHYRVSSIGHGVGVIAKTLPSSYLNTLQGTCKELFKFYTERYESVVPVPKIEIHSKCEYINDVLAPTAYYTPVDRTITLFVAGRHIKDILRSYCHELIHHIQNCEGRVGTVTTTDTNSDSNLVKLEEEAYLKGNMLFRNWTDSKKAL